MVWFEVLIDCIVALILVPVSVFFAQVLMALPRIRHRENISQIERPGVAVLIPAHNEKAVIGNTLLSIFPHLSRKDRLLVVADNCSDDTPVIARKMGAEVIERTDPERRGKGFALDYGIRHLENDPRDVVIVIDADCQVEAGTLDRLAHLCLQTARPVQALYLMHAPPGASLKTQIAEFAWAVKNLVRPLGYARMGLPCQLMGTGMAFPWSLICNATLASSHIVEDLKLGLDLARLGKAPLFAPDAKVTSLFPGTEEGLRTQRNRWEHGHLGVIFSEAPRLLQESVLKTDISLLALALDLCVPPLALLSILVAIIFIGCVAFYPFYDSLAPVYLGSTVLVMLILSVLFAWLRVGQTIIPFSKLLYAPFYAASKIPIYLKFIMGHKVEWIRSRRDEK